MSNEHISSSLKSNVNKLKDQFGDSADLLIRTITVNNINVGRRYDKSSNYVRVYR